MGKHARPAALGQRLPRTRTSPALRRALALYPRPAELPDGAVVTLRPLTADDRDKLVALFIDIPHEELRNLQDNVSDPTVVRRWCRNLNYERVLPIVVELDGNIVGDATLHRRAVGPTATSAGSGHTCAPSTRTAESAPCSFKRSWAWRGSWA